MYFTTKYKIYTNDYGNVVLEIYEDNPICPYCGGKLRLRDHRERIMRMEGGKVCFLIIRRLQCTCCKKIHSELPACFVPYKHYIIETIQGVIDNIITGDDPDSEDENGEQRPCESTVNRWKEWFGHNMDQIEGFLRSVGTRILKLNFTDPSKSLLQAVRDTFTDWLSVICRIIYNSAGALLT